MRIRKILLVVVVGAFFVMPATADAQFTKEWKDWYGHFAGGYSGTQGDFSHIMENGWNISGGATYRPKPWPVGITIDLGFNDFNMTNDAADYFESSGGDGSVWSLTSGAIWAPKLSGSIGFNLQAGLGVYHVKGQLTEPTYGCGWVCDPWYYWYCWWDCGTGDYVTDSISTTDIGYNIGAAVTFTLDGGSQIYIEAKYHRIETEVVTEYFPVLVGFRW